MQEVDLDINYMLIKLELINGYLKNGIVDTTKFGLLMQFCNFSIAFAFIKWFMLLFYPNMLK